MNTIQFDNYKSAAEHLPEKTNTFFISPSAFPQFINKKHKWFREQFIGEDIFAGNTGSHLGNIVHKAAELFMQGIDITNEQCEEYINSLPDNEHINKNIMRSSYRQMIDSLLTGYLMDISVDETEKFIYYDMSSTVTIGGTFDYVRTENGNKIIGDYKTTSSKLPPKRIDANHRLQALIYCYIMDKSGLERPDMLEIVYITRPHAPVISEKTGKPGKEYFATTTVLQEVVTDDDMEYIDSLMNLCTDTFHYFVKHPEVAHILYSDQRLKEYNFNMSKYAAEESTPLI
jgi:hypothetical protein